MEKRSLLSERPPCVSYLLIFFQVIKWYYFTANFEDPGNALSKVFSLAVRNIFISMYFLTPLIHVLFSDKYSRYQVCNKTRRFFCSRSVAYHPRLKAESGGTAGWHSVLLSDSVSNRNEYQEYFLGGKGGRWVRLTNFPHSCADCLEIWEPQPAGTLNACPDMYMNCFNLILESKYAIVQSLDLVANVIVPFFFYQRIIPAHSGKLPFLWIFI